MRSVHCLLARAPSRWRYGSGFDGNESLSLRFLLLAVSAAWVAAAGCGTGASSRDRQIGLARPDAIYEILHRETRELAGQDPHVVQTKVLMRVSEVRPDGSRRLRLRLWREVSEGGEDSRLADEVIDVEVSASGEVVGAPARMCGHVGEPRIGRYVRHLLGARTFRTRHVDEGERWRGTYRSDLTDRASPAMFQVDEVAEDAIRGRLVSRVDVEHVQVGAFRVSGRGRIRGLFTVSPTDGFSGWTELRTEIDGRLYEPGTGPRRVARLRIRSQVLARPAREQDLELVPLHVDFGQIRAHLRPIQRCYEERLRRSGALSGRVMVRFTIGVDGRVRGPHATENTTGDAGVAACVIATVQRFRFRPGPLCGPVTFAYPFVFAPQHTTSMPRSRYRAAADLGPLPEPVLPSTSTSQRSQAHHRSSPAPEPREHVGVSGRCSGDAASI